MSVYISDIQFKMTYWPLGGVPDKDSVTSVGTQAALNDFIKTTYNHGGKYSSSMKIKTAN